MLDNFFKTTDCDNMKITPEQNKLINKNFEFVKGSDFYKGYYDNNTIKTIIIKYYQIALFDEFEKRSIRSFIFEGKSSKGACFFDYSIVKIKNYRLSKKKVDEFVDYLNNKKKTNNNEFKLMYKFHPVYNFEYTNPPTGNEINECVSELLN